MIICAPFAFAHGRCLQKEFPVYRVATDKVYLSVPLIDGIAFAMLLALIFFERNQSTLGYVGQKKKKEKQQLVTNMNSNEMENWEHKV